MPNHHAPSTKLNLTPGQLRYQRQRRLGIFLHFGINTFHDVATAVGIRVDSPRARLDCVHGFQTGIGRAPMLLSRPTTGGVDSKA